MKHIIALLLALLLSMSLIPACAEETAAPQYSTTQDFIRELEARSLNYAYHGMNGDKEIVYSGLRDDELNKSFTAAVIFLPNLAGCDICLWNIIEYDDAHFIDVLYTCNDINSSGNFAKFFADTSDNTVTAECDVMFTEETAGIVALNNAVELIRLVLNNYAALAEYAK